MRLKSFDVDLRSYFGEEYERRFHRLDALSWTMSEYANNPKVFRLSVDLDMVNLPLPDAFDVPEIFIHATDNSN